MEMTHMVCEEWHIKIIYYGNMAHLIGTIQEKQTNAK